jgi:hypothetical protein
MRRAVDVLAQLGKGPFGVGACILQLALRGRDGRHTVDAHLVRGDAAAHLGDSST